MGREEDDERIASGAKEQDKCLALMVYETWLLNGATSASMPSLRLRRWCNRQLNRQMFPDTNKEALDRANR